MTGSTDRRNLLVGLGAFAATLGSQIGSDRAQTVRDSTAISSSSMGKLPLLTGRTRTQLRLPLRTAALLLWEVIPTFFSERPRMCDASISMAGASSRA